jgi:hypothetical protein
MLQSKVFAKSCRELGLKYIAQNPIRPRPMARPNASSRPHSGNGLMLSHTQPQITARLNFQSKLATPLQLVAADCQR